MNKTLAYILNKFDINNVKSPIYLNKNRWRDFTDLITDFKFTSGVEIGVERGLFSKRLCRLNPQLKLYGVDAWQTIKGYRDHVEQVRLDAFYRETQERMKPYNYQIIRDWSVNAAEKFSEECLDFVYIDAGHDYKSVSEDLRAWVPKVKHGGLVAGHDYINEIHRIKYGVIQAVNEWVAINKIDYLFILNAEKSPSWFFVKP